MSRMNTPGSVVVAPSNNVYTALAAISFLATAGALVYMFIRLRELGLL
ncbi:MAG: hypothetical protein FWD61_05805 [Phycisphaerales bacterium]|nr:hypothetical protein [Phycisphaerales bacterium]